MEEPRDDIGPMEASNPDAPWWPADFMEKLQLVSATYSTQTSESKELNKHEVESSAPERASQILWATGKLAEPIPDGFYFVIPERRFKELFDTIPSLDDLFSLDVEGLRPNVIVVDTLKDKKLSMLKQLTLTLVKGLSASPAAVVKKIAALVCDFYKRPKYRRNALDEVSRALDSQGIHMLCQMKSRHYHSQAILFKVLADAVGLECKLIVGHPREGVMERDYTYEPISVTVILNSVEFLVDLVLSPGKMVPFTSHALFLSHICASRDINSVESNSYCSPVEPNSPICLVSDQLGIEGISSGESIQTAYQHKLEASTNVSTPSLTNQRLQSQSMIDGSSQSEPDVARSFWWHNRKKNISEQRATSPSPEHHLFRGQRRSILGDRRYSIKGYCDDTSTSRSAGASPIEARRRRRRCVSMIPEIGDNIVRAVRAMNEAVKQNRLPREQDVSTNDFSAEKRDDDSNSQASALRFHTNDHEGINDRSSLAYVLQRKQINSHKAISLPSSPQYFKNQIPRRADRSTASKNPHMISRFDKVLESSKLVNQPLLPFEEWNIDFSEVNIGIRVGIGFFGEVFRGIWNGIEVAVKVYLEQDLSQENIEDFANEISILSRIRHPNVILFLGACTKPPLLSMVTEFMEMGSLYHLIHASGQKNKLSWRRRLKMLCDICRGLIYIHRMKIAHRDLKSANCLVNKHWKVKICDFGLSRLLTTKPMRDSSAAGTPEWMAPELIRNEPFTEKCDIFSLGVIIWELYTLNRPWEGNPSVQVVYAVANDGKRLDIPDGPVGKLISDCWVEQPDERPDSLQVLSRLLELEHTVS
ncbi:hypothetical protein DM860_003501 [Cuscuta australis]|uniref:non-specific serine/threonine protein kinase n=1 Tax=Cuscuta australis TaxID=267555 RepID=A0A328DG21_9ASTE|nr:hypothetical protein DM860_003501 [Cuscuta australis]